MHAYIHIHIDTHDYKRFIRLASTMRGCIIQQWPSAGWSAWGPNSCSVRPRSWDFRTRQINDAVLVWYWKPRNSKGNYWLDPTLGEWRSWIRLATTAASFFFCFLFFQLPANWTGLPTSRVGLPPQFPVPYVNYLWKHSYWHTQDSLHPRYLLMQSSWQYRLTITKNI